MVRGLLGFGFGLTSSGDDFVLGMIALMNPRQIPTDVIREIVLSYRNPFPKTILLNALDGQYPEPIQLFFEAIANGKNLDEGVEQLMRICHTSSCDMLAGFPNALELLWA